ncbi:MAG TPA: hypothetical protein VEA59_04140 [Patescibacteria group bacterium]|nr:hypothetical protein [Patescibacteria group bacterium]
MARHFFIPSAVMTKQNRGMKGGVPKSRRINVTVALPSLERQQIWFSSAPLQFRLDVGKIAQNVVARQTSVMPPLTAFTLAISNRYPGTRNIARGYLAIPIPNCLEEAVVSLDELTALGHNV